MNKKKQFYQLSTKEQYKELPKGLMYSCDMFEDVWGKEVSFIVKRLLACFFNGV